MRTSHSATDPAVRGLGIVDVIDGKNDNIEQAVAEFAPEQGHVLGKVVLRPGRQARPFSRGPEPS